MRKPLYLLGAAVLLVVALVVFRTARFGSTRPAVEPAPHVTIRDGAAARLAGSLRIRTISNEDPAAFDAQAFRNLHVYLETAFPRVHSQLRREVVATHSLLYTWLGTDTSLQPVLLMGHLDVVPVEHGTEKQWKQDPFGGLVADGFIWGRGAIDNKATVVGTLEAVEMLLSEGFRPKRTVYLAFGHDEELGGTKGAREIAALLTQRGVKLQMVVDEGGVIGQGIVPGVSAPTALVGIAEKGFASLELSVRAAGGHSSLPPPQSAIGILSAAIARLEAQQMPARLEVPTRLLFERIGAQLPFAQRVVFANLWLGRPLVLRSLEGSPATNAMVRTTTAVTVFQAGTKDNVLPAHARAVLNFRLLQGDSVAGVVEHARRVIDDARIEIRTAGAFAAEPSAVSSAEDATFKALERTIRSVAPDAIVAPYPVVVVTDARHYSGLSRNIFRFLPLRLSSGDLARMHGTDERVAVRDYEGAIRFYRHLIASAATN
ncbi:MAG: M20 family peptidase [Gemmatimonadaceae bacterium]